MTMTRNMNENKESNVFTKADKINRALNDVLMGMK